MKRKTIVATGIGTAVVLALGAGFAYSAANSSPAAKPGQRVPSGANNAMPRKRHQTQSKIVAPAKRR